MNEYKIQFQVYTLYCNPAYILETSFLSNLFFEDIYIYDREFQFN